MMARILHTVAIHSLSYDYEEEAAGSPYRSVSFLLLNLDFGFSESSDFQAFPFLVCEPVCVLLLSELLLAEDAADSDSIRCHSDWSPKTVGTESRVEYPFLFSLTRTILPITMKP